LEKKFSNPFIKISISKIIELSAKNLFSIKINLLATTITMKNFIELSRPNYGNIASNQSKFVLPNLLITVNLSKHEKALYLLCKDKKAFYGSFYNWVKTANSKVFLFIVVSDTILIEYKIFNSEKYTAEVAISKLWLVYCISGIQIYLLSTKQIL